jgi:hypothetical protein
MASYLNLAYARYVPEALPEAFRTNVVAAGNEIGRYENFGKRLVEIRNVVSTRPAAFPVETTISTDMSDEAQKLYSAAQAGILNDDSAANNNKIRSKSYVHIQQRSVGGAEANISTRYHTIVRGYSLLDLYRWGVKNPAEALNMVESRLAEADRTRILDSANIVERAMIGDLPVHQDLLNPSVEEQFEDVKEVGRQIPLLPAGGGTHVLSGNWIRVPPGYVAVILGIGVDSAQVIANLSAGALDPYDACMIFIHRDDMDNYARLDAACMPSGIAGAPDVDMRMFIPAISKFQIQITNNHAVNAVAANLRVRVRYGLRKMTVLDHQKWGIPYSTDIEQSAANALIEKYLINDKIYIGEQ